MFETRTAAPLQPVDGAVGEQVEDDRDDREQQYFHHAV